MPNALTLVIGNKNYSSWSLRAWLVLRHFDIAFDEVRLPMDTPEFYARIGKYSQAGRVPVLVEGTLRVWDTMAIVEYVNERHLGGRGWPTDVSARAIARSVSSEMHSGFTALRRDLPMNCAKRVRGFVPGEDAARDISRVRQIWRDTRARHGAGGKFLFREFSIADAMYAPVVLRFVSYDVKLDQVERDYSDAVLALPAMRTWLAEAAQESDRSDSHERMTP